MDNDEVLIDPNISAECDDVIEFKGTICERARLDRMSRISRIVIIPLAIAEAIVLLATILCLLYSADEAGLGYVAYALIPLLVGGAICIILTYCPNKSARLWYATYLMLPITIAIGSETVTNSHFKKNLTIGVKPIHTVKKVLDVGEWYYIIFKFGDIGNSWVCQKDLLTKGTIEDFEKLFNGKIVRKTISKS